MAVISCGICEQVVYPDCVKFANHTVTIEQGVIVWTSRDFDMVVHQCHSDLPDHRLRAVGSYLFRVDGGPVTFYGNTQPPEL